MLRMLYPPLLPATWWRSCSSWFESSQSSPACFPLPPRPAPPPRPSLSSHAAPPRITGLCYAISSLQCHRSLQWTDGCTHSLSSSIKMFFNHRSNINQNDRPTGRPGKLAVKRHIKWWKSVVEFCQLQPTYHVPLSKFSWQSHVGYGQ